MNIKLNHGLTGKLVSRRDRGFAIVAVTILLATAIVLTAAMTVETSRKLEMVRHTESIITAKLMAQSGLERGIVELAADLEGYGGTPITEVETRRVYIVETPNRDARQVELVSIGVADGVAQQMNAIVALDSGVSSVFDKAIYAGNVPPDPDDQENLPPENQNYRLEFGGEGADGDVEVLENFLIIWKVCPI